MLRYVIAAVMLVVASPVHARCHASPDVVMYVTKWCAFCGRLQKELDARGIRYATCDIDASVDCEQILVQMTGEPRIPTTIVCNEVFVGDEEPDRIQAAVEEHLRTTHPGDLDY